MNYQDERTADRPALFALIAIGILFIGIVSFGWARMFLSWGVPALSYLVGFIFAGVATALAYATAAERLHSGRTNTVAASYFFILFILSSLGTINTLFINFSGVIIAKESISLTQEAFTNLKTKSIALLETNEWNTYSKSVRDKLEDLNKEITSKNNCGQGPEALKRMSELVAVLPNFKALAAGACKDNDSLTKSYADQVEYKLENSPQHQASGNKIAARIEIIGASEKNWQILNDLTKTTNGMSDLASGRKILEESVETYHKLKQTLDSIAPNNNLPAKIDISSFIALGNIGQVINLFISRAFDPAAYAYLLIALMLDIIFVVAFQRTLRIDRDPSDRGRRERPTRI